MTDPAAARWWLRLVECGARYQDVLGKTCRCTLRRGHEGRHLDAKGIRSRLAR